MRSLGYFFAKFWPTNSGCAPPPSTRNGSKSNAETVLHLQGNPSNFSAALEIDE